MENLLRDKNTYYKNMFLASAVWNVVSGLGGLLIGRKASSSIEKTSGLAGLSTQLFSALNIVLGVGYYWVSQDLSKRDIVKLGVIGKSGVFLLGLTYVLRGKISPVMLLVGTGELIYAALFAEFLANKKQ